MANFNVLIPFILYYEAGLCCDDMVLPLRDIYLKAKERGYSNDPADAGGPTMCGVTQTTLSAFQGKAASIADLKALSFSDWCEILKKMYWDVWRGDEIADQSLANLLVDFVWGSGVSGIKVPQRILGVTADGIVGPKTLSALNGAEPRALFDSLHAARIGFVEDIVRRKPSQAWFLKGWERRINAITYDGLRYE